MQCSTSATPCLNTIVVLQKRVIVYYGASGHGKGLVDAMSGFKVKEPLHKAVITGNFPYNSSSDICEYVADLVKDDRKHYFS